LLVVELGASALLLLGSFDWDQEDPDISA